MVTNCSVQPNADEFERPILRMGSVTFLAGLIIILVSTMFHASREDLNNHLLVFAEYATSDPWIATHIGQFAGVMFVFAGGFVALYRLLVRSESGTASALAWLGFALTITAASTFAILQAVDGIALKSAVNSSAATTPEEKTAAFRVAEGIRWTEIGINSIFRILQGTVAVIFGIAIAIGAPLSRWIGVFGVLAGAGHDYCWCGCGVCWFFLEPRSRRKSLDRHFLLVVRNPRYFYVEKNHDKDEHLMI